MAERRGGMNEKLLHRKYVLSQIASSKKCTLVKLCFVSIWQVRERGKKLH